MGFYDINGEIKYLNRLTQNVFHSGIKCPEIAKVCSPGQFVMVRINENYNPLLRRPFSILRTLPIDGIIEIVFKIVGKGTKLLSEKRVGEFIKVIGPLGNGFKYNEECKNFILIGGGIGFPPLFFMVDVLKNENKNISFYYGAKSKDGVFFGDELQKSCKNLIISTEDGSAGKKGLISDLLIGDIESGIFEKKSSVFSCGPNAMLKKVSLMFRKLDVRHQISLETQMACGIGLCQGCAIKVKANNDYEYKLTCKDGPVFNPDEIIWED